MIRILYIIKKEMTEIVRDPQFLLLLILMPATFILVMSLSMQALFQPGSDFKINIIAVDLDKSSESGQFMEILKTANNISITESETGHSADHVLDAVLKGSYNFGLVINRNFSAHIREINRAATGIPMTVYIEPAIQNSIQMGVKNQLVMELLKLRAHTFFNKNAALLSYAGFKEEYFMPPVDRMLDTKYAVKGGRETIMPNAAQQSVPAWLVFSMYFIVMPISLIFHTEKSNGTLSRMKSINIKSSYLITGKIVSYYIISMMQVVCMLFVGRFLVPLLGGDTIQFGSSLFGLFLIATCVGLNSISYGLLVSASSKNTQVAGSLGSILIIIFSAIGGIMVPKFIMPAIMQKLSLLSPLSWGLDGFLDIMLRNGSVSEIVPECALLLGTSIIMLVITGIVLKKKTV